MRRTAGADIITWYRHDTDLSLDLDLATIIERLSFLFCLKCYFNRNIFNNCFIYGIFDLSHIRFG